jgi:SHS family lactate transporter-like MFS transporter
MHPVPNPWKLLRMLSAQQWAFFAVAFVAWVSFLVLSQLSLPDLV